MSDIKYSFGVKALIFYNRTTLKPVGVFRVISSVEYASETEQLLLQGGHRNGAWAAEAGEPTQTLTATLKQFPNFYFTEMNNADLTTTLSEDTSGFIGTIANKSGTSVVNATTGIASVSIISGSEALVPLGRISVVAASATTVDVYLLGDVASGALPVTDELTLLGSGITIADSGATVDLASYGIRITSGSGTVALTTGESAVFTCRPANSKTTEIVMPDSSDIKILGCVLVYPKNSEKQQKIVDFPKVSVSGLVFSANTREFAEFEMTATPLYDEDELSLFTKTEILATN